MADEGLERFDALPVAIVLKETPALAVAHVFDCKRAGLRQVLFETVAQALHPIGEGAAQHQHAVTLVAANLFCCDLHDKAPVRG
jgi:hypothetical protein